MSTIPIRRPFFYDPVYDMFDRPRVFDHHLRHGFEEDDFFSPTAHMRSPFYFRPMRRQSRQETGASQITNDREKFEIKLDVQQFTPEELLVKTVDNAVIIEGKHEERQDESGFISRHFVRRYILPEDVRLEDVNCNLSSDGILVVHAPKSVDNDDVNGVVIPITQTGKPAVVTPRKSSSDENRSDNERSS